MPWFGTAWLRMAWFHVTRFRVDAKNHFHRAQMPRFRRRPPAVQKECVGSQFFARHFDRIGNIRCEIGLHVNVLVGGHG